jgi:hypothetical protein
MKKTSKKKFSIAISYEEHKEGAEKTFQTEVLPLLEKERNLKRKYNLNKQPELTPTQKALLNCHNPI